MVVPADIAWALIGLILTVGGTFAEAFVTNPPWAWGTEGIQPYSLGVTYQVGAVLFISCAGGRNAGVLAQVAYLTLGLFFFPVFAEGGTLGYWREPTFGYLLGFLPGAWICGTLAFQSRLRILNLAGGCLAGLVCIQSMGFCYLSGLFGLGLVAADGLTWGTALYHYGFKAIPGQLAIACSATVLAFILRRFLLFERWD